MLAVPEFSVSISLSEAARKRLQTLHESVLVIAYFDGDALPGQGKYNAPMRDVVLGSDQKIVDAKNEATFSASKISQANWNRLSNKDYFVTINTVSARKAAKDNLVYCEDPEGRISAFAGRVTQISCRLIEEQFRQ